MSKVLYNGGNETPDVLNGVTLTGTVTANSSVGTSGQLLSSTGTGVQWVTAPLVSTTANTTILPADNGKMAVANAGTLTFNATNLTSSYVGFSMIIVNSSTTTAVTLTATSMTFQLAGQTSTATTRYLAPGGIATVLYTSGVNLVLSGVGLY